MLQREPDFMTDPYWSVLAPALYLVGRCNLYPGLKALRFNFDCDKITALSS